MEALLSKSAGKQMEWNKSGYKPAKIVYKIFADLFVYCIAIFDLPTLWRQWWISDYQETSFHFPAGMVY